MTSILKATETAPGGTKQDRVIAMLRAPKGVTIETIGKATGWQRHSVRGFFSAVVGKKLGLKLASQEAEGGRIYRIVGGGSKGGVRAKATPKKSVRAAATKRASKAKA